MSYSKLILGSLLSVSISFAIAQTQGSNVQGLEKCEYRTFTTTAYYSPKPGQVIYATANLTTEKTLNGHGLYGASGKEVFNGMIAAPQSYPFGDYVVIDGLGIGQIHDRGGAIVSAGKRGHKYDRLDIYMGEGNEGLIKAMTRGVKNVNAYYCEQSKISIPQEDIGFNLAIIPNYANFLDIGFSMIAMGQKRKDAFVYKLQQYLSALGYIDAKRITGYYGPRTSKAVCDFQLVYGIVSKGSEWCGYFGRQTSGKLREVMKEKNLYPKDLWSTTTIENIITTIQKVNNSFS